MAHPKGVPNPNAGRPPGSPNKATLNGREAIAAFVDGNTERLNGWLDQIAAESPKDAFNCFMSVVEYHIPKLQRTETKNEHTGNVGVSVINLGDDPTMIDKLNLLYNSKNSDKT